MHSALPARPEPLWSGVFNLLNFDHISKKERNKACDPERKPLAWLKARRYYKIIPYKANNYDSIMRTTGIMIVSRIFKFSP